MGAVAGATGAVAGATVFVAGATAVCSTDVFDFLGIFFVLFRS